MSISPIPRVPSVAVAALEVVDDEEGEIGVDDGMNLWVVMIEGAYGEK